MRIYIIGTGGITLCREAPATVNEGEISTSRRSIGPMPRWRRITIPRSYAVTKIGHSPSQRSAIQHRRHKAGDRRLCSKITFSVGYTGVRDERPTPAASKTDCTNSVLALL